MPAPALDPVSASAHRCVVVEQVAVDIDFHRTMYDLHHRVNPKEVIVGWFSTGLGVDASDALLQVGTPRVGR
jgi:hypothetical protein